MQQATAVVVSPDLGMSSESDDKEAVRALEREKEQMRIELERKQLARDYNPITPHHPHQELEAKNLELKLREQSSQKNAELSLLSDKLNRSAAERENLKSEMDALQELVHTSITQLTSLICFRLTSSKSSWRQCRARC